MSRHSLKSKKMIQTLLNSGQRSHSGRLTIYQDKDIPGLENSYAGAYLVPKKAGTAVKRNRLKRWLREDLRELHREGKLQGAIVIRFNGSADNVTHRSLRENLREIFNSGKEN
ncbi:MAG TPA: ribonuclease P protein component [candidate division Zixibacteria bacterium]|nr:ribonuclease P protein component [candidate division Zixibacteria bacterium]